MHFLGIRASEQCSVSSSTWEWLICYLSTFGFIENDFNYRLNASIGFEFDFRLICPEDKSVDRFWNFGRPILEFRSTDSPVDWYSWKIREYRSTDIGKSVDRFVAVTVALPKIFKINYFKILGNATGESVDRNSKPVDRYCKNKYSIPTREQNATVTGKSVDRFRHIGRPIFQFFTGIPVFRLSVDRNIQIDRPICPLTKSA